MTIRVGELMSDIEEFFSAESYAVAGASTNPEKYGNKVFAALIASGRDTFPLNPTGSEVQGHTAYPSISALPSVPESLSIVTPPPVTRQVVDEAHPIRKLAQRDAERS